MSVRKPFDTSQIPDLFVRFDVATQGLTGTQQGNARTNIGAEPIIVAGTTSQYWRGDKSWQTLNTSIVSESGNLYYTDVRVRAALLTGYSVGANTALAVTDSILVAMGKIQGQLNSKQALGSYANASHTHDAANIVSGVLATARLGAGTANTTTFLRGDGTWQVVSAGSGGSVTSVTGAGGYGGLTLSGSITSTGNLTLGGTPSGTWPISVSGNATTAGGLVVGTGVNNTANQIVRTNASGYCDFGWINTQSGVAAGTPTRVYCSQDAYIRYYDMTTFTGHVRTAASGTWAINITGSASGFSTAIASGYINDLNIAWITPGSSISNGMYLYRYDTFAINKPISVNNANWVLNIYSHPSGGTASYGHQLAAGDSENIFFRKVINGSFGAWRDFWHTGNLATPVQGQAGSGYTVIATNWVGSQAQYDAIVTKSPSTIYFII